MRGLTLLFQGFSLVHAAQPAALFAIRSGRPAGAARIAAAKSDVMSSVTNTAYRAGLLGSFVSAMGCPACFPALASLGAAAGVGFLGQYEGVFIRILLPAFAGIALVANALAWFSHRRWQRTALGVLGPLLILAAVAVMRIYGERTGWLLYPGLVLMTAVALWEILPAHRGCAVAVRPSVADGRSGANSAVSLEPR